MYHFELKPARKNNFWSTNAQLEKEVEKLFDVFSTTDYFAPVCEIHDEEKMYSISLDIPGARKEEIELEIKDNRLHVTGERKNAVPMEKENVIRSERRYGKFSRVFSLPQNVNPEAIQAHFENGVLDISLPKEEKSQSKKIAISDWGKKDPPVELKN